MDAIDSVFDPLREFSKDSVRLVKRCHKPDRKDAVICCFRVHEGGFPYSDRIRSDGIRRFLCETHIYPHQQHHCWIRLDQISPRSHLNEWIAWMDPGLIAKCRDRWQCGEMEC
ncbi:hypothetical protein POTOM_002538 [Populus tomentosa]|uniref:Uncharacterized protein n=1 Tax=Populus tomentosa TaxID=118781 RepID=A0A8X8IXC2_POPTO|nr:hypothetical protein POTOM_002538 [Populus tomentosa]